MVWARLDDQFPQHKKVWPRSDAAFRLHVAGICHSSWLLTNGVIDGDRVAGLVPSYRRKSLAELVDVGMWHAHGHTCEDCADPPEGSYVIHDFLETNPSEEKVKADRDAKAERQRKWRDRKLAEKTSKDATRDALRDARRDGAPSQDPTRPGPKGLGSGYGSTSDVDPETLAAEGGERPDTSLPDEMVELAKQRLQLLRGSA